MSPIGAVPSTVEGFPALQSNVIPLTRRDEHLPFHPLADLFPLIEGAEFDELVASIKENGQLEPIITLNGAILDGRNRYRACLKAEVSPLTEAFNGSDPVRFVICKNIQRRHLNAVQRAALAAQFCTLVQGQRPPRSSQAPGMKQAEAAKIFDVSPDTIRNAKVILENGTDEEKALLTNGSLALEPTANAIRCGSSPVERKAHRERPLKGHSEQRTQTKQIQADIWLRLKEAVGNLTSLPLPSEVVAIARTQDKRTGGKAINQRLSPALQWLKEFSDAWNDNRG
jgi:hypothetical protein